MNIFLTIVAAIASAYISYKLVKSSFKGSLGLDRESRRERLLSSGLFGSEKAKILDNKPMQGMDINKDGLMNNMSFSQPMIPDMSGADNGNKNKFNEIMRKRRFSWRIWNAISRWRRWRRSCRHGRSERNWS